MSLPRVPFMTIPVRFSRDSASGAGKHFQMQILIAGALYSRCCVFMSCMEMTCAGDALSVSDVKVSTSATFALGKER